MICHVFLNMHFQMETLQILTIVVTEIIAILSRTRYTKKEKYIGFFGKGQYMCKKKEAESTLDSLVFMNTPITSADEDVIGFSTYVEKLDAAITAGGQMIALTSPFGAGKTSIVELLQEKYRENQHKRVIKISMWSNLFPTGGNGKADREEGQKTHIHSGDTTELHKGLVYQLISQINWRKGNYVSRRLSQNFGLLKVQTDKLPYWISILMALVLFSLGYIFPKKLEVSIPFFGEAAAIIEWCMLLIAAILVAIVITRAEIVFSSNKSEGDRKIDANEIMQFYRSDVLRYKSGKAVLQKVPILKRRSRHYIVVIEDLDRTDDNDAVVNFLKELRKYYVPDSVAGQQCRYRNKVTFLINVKPETLLCSKENAGEEYGHLYEKLFDYVLNLQTINIDDYKTILNELLKQKEADIKKVGIEWEGEVLNIPGIQWIIRGTRLGLREIKDRLNIAFSLFESLHERFSGNAGGDIEFEKCAIVAYITTEFEEDFYATDGKAFQKLVNLYLKNGFKVEEIAKILPGISEGYRSEIQQLVKSKKIDNNYRMYFYNYPQNSKVLNVDERTVQRAILYGEEIAGLEESIDKVIEGDSKIIESTFEERKRLELPLPDVVFSFEQLYIEALKHAFSEVVKWVSELDYSSDATEKTIMQIKKILRFDSDRKFYTAVHATDFVRVWEEKFSETALLQLRKELCREFSGEIQRYRPLFFGVHKMASKEELDNVTTFDALKIVNTASKDFNTDMAYYMTVRFVREASVDAIQADMRKFLTAAWEMLQDASVLVDMLFYQKKIMRITPDFESLVFTAISNGKGDICESLFGKYQQLVNMVAEESEEGLSEQTTDYISTLGRFEGYTPAVTKEMEIYGHWVDVVLQMLSREDPIPFDCNSVVTALQEEQAWLIENNDYLMAIRELVLKEKPETWRRYKFLFGEECPVMTETELQRLFYAPIEDVISMIPPSLVTENEVEMLSRCFNRRKQGTTESHKILLFIAKLAPEVASKLFYSLDFDMVRYRYMSAQRKNSVKGAFEAILNLNATTEKIRFMTATRIMDSEWEGQMLKNGELKEDEDLQQAYVDAVNSSDLSKTITKTTVQLLCSFDTVYTVPEQVYKRYFDLKQYERYVSCKTRALRRFEPEDSEHGKILWPIYLAMFQKEDYLDTTDYMAKNENFIKKLMSEKAYEGTCPEKLRFFAGVLQSKDCIEFVLGLDVESALTYLTAIKGFEDKSAATAFVDGVEGNVELLRSDGLYEHTHEKLLDGYLKGRYTRARTKNGFGKAS